MIFTPAHTGFVFFMQVATFIFRKNKRYSSYVIHTHMVFFANFIVLYSFLFHFNFTI